jgi:hypothetical protein
MMRADSERMMAGIWMPLSVLANLRGLVGEAWFCNSFRHLAVELFLTGGGELRLLV